MEKFIGSVIIIVVAAFFSAPYFYLLNLKGIAIELQKIREIMEKENKKP